MNNDNNCYVEELRKLSYYIPRLELAIIINKFGNIIKMASSTKLIKKIGSISRYSSTLNLHTKPLINLIFLGEIDNISIKGTLGYFLIIHIDSERLLIILTSEQENLGRILFYSDKIIEELQSIPYDPKENNLDEELYFI